MRIGVVALQGDYLEHMSVMIDAGLKSVAVKSVADLNGVEGLVFPGGESTTQCKLIDSSGLRDPISAAIADGMPVLGTCAGLIMLAHGVIGGRDDQWSFGVLEVSVLRNGFGRQVRSFETDIEIKGIEGPMHATFIRAPVIEEVKSDSVEVLANVAYRFRNGNERTVPVVVRQRNIVASSFHPELDRDPRLHLLAFGA